MPLTRTLQLFPRSKTPRSFLPRTSFTTDRTQQKHCEFLARYKPYNCSHASKRQQFACQLQALHVLGRLGNRSSRTQKSCIGSYYTLRYNKHDPHKYKLATCGWCKCQALCKRTTCRNARCNTFGPTVAD